MKYFLLHLFSAILLSVSFNCRAAPQYRLRTNFTTENGLPQNSVYSLAIDQSHYVWITTRDYLVRYDGARLKVMAKGSFKGTHARMGNLALIDNILHLCDFNVNHNAISSQSIGLYQNKDSSILMRLADHNYLRLKTNPPSFLKEYFFDDPNGKYISDEEDPRIYSSTGKEGYLERGTSLYYFKGNSSEKISDNLSGQHQIAYVNETLYLFQNGKMSSWTHGKISDADRAILQKNLKYDKSGIPQFQFYKKFGKDYFIEGDSLFLVSTDRQNVILTLLTSELKAENISCILYDSSLNLLLVGSITNGLSIYHSTPLQVLNYTPTPWEHTVNSLYAIEVRGDSTILTPRGPLKQNQSLNPISEMWNRYCFVKLTDAMFLTNKDSAFYMADANLKKVALVPEFPKGILHCYLKYKHYFFIGLEDRVVKIRVVGSSIIIENSWEFRNKGVLSSLGLSPDSTLIIGSELGLYSLSEQSGQISLITNKIQNIRSLYIASNHTLFVGTYGLGWYRWESGKFRPLPLDPKSYLNFTHAFAEDEKGYLWVSTNNGLFRFLLSDVEHTEAGDNPLYYNYLGKSYGSLTSEYNGGGYPAVQHLPDGQLAFASINGLVYFDPNTIFLEESRFPLHIDEVLAEGKPIHSPYLLKPNFNQLQLQVSTPYFGDAYNQNIEYRFDGMGEEWNKLGKDGIIIFNSLRSGDYKLIIRKTNGFGRNKIETEVVDFEVMPYWYQRNIVIIGGIFSLLLGIVSITWWRFRRLAHHKIKLESTVRLRTQDLSNSLETLEKTINELNDSQYDLEKSTYFREQLTSSVLHDIRSPLAFVDKELYNIYDSLPCEDLIRNKILSIYDAVQGISSQSSDLLAWIHQNDISTTTSNTKPICGIISELIARYKPLADSQNTELKLICDYNGNINIQQNLLVIIVRNLIDNAIKNTVSGTIVVTCRIANEQLTMEVADTGRGMSAEQSSHLTNFKPEDIQDNSGFGYRLIHTFLQKLNGQIFIESKEALGTKVSITIPL